MDLLAELLATSGVRGTHAARIDGGEHWGWWAAPAPTAAFHVVTTGSAWLGTPGQAPIELAAGDLVLLATGAEHVLADDLASLERTRGPDSADGYEDAGPGAVRFGSGPVRAQILCANSRHDPAVSAPVLAALPDLVLLRSRSRRADGLADTVRLLARELASPGAATSVVLDRLVDIFLVQVLRAWLDEQDEPQHGSWLGALHDPVIGAAVALLHGDLARPWTTAMLADELAVSRATLSRRFPAVLGETPAAYLSRRRMDLAARRLRDTDEPLDAIAASVGYTSVYAFSRAFARARAQPPGRFRSDARLAGGPVLP